ncbi:hypothetical protein ACOQFV_24645 [Nocardiopsis changdeensis]|uniref:Uncharacterized protein n=1 Tax=Nocardiopsis changdeensis TaxID=2831969 RepID=A0A975KT01_9ACTN|nr:MULTISPECIES: hypothetical protein [Nocardiopsis]QUX26420.1 hypothetical protein KGD84_32495 [Nocardiopsis changdeensis]QYX40692.1 hypothetical protein K1J57_32345 [Nocardiopsis sp. MT53]
MSTTTPFPGWGDPAVLSEEADGPEDLAIRTWAERYIPPHSAEAFAEHAWSQWDEYEPDGSQTVGEFLCDLLRQWRGESGGYPPTPQG